MIRRLWQTLRNAVSRGRGAAAGPGEGTLQLTPLASGKLRLTVSAAVIELDPAAALDIARTLRTLALRLAPQGRAIVPPGGRPKESADRVQGANGGRLVAVLDDDAAVRQLLRGAYPVPPRNGGPRRG